MPTWVQHWDVISGLVGGLFIIVSFFMVRTLKKIDQNQTELFQRLHNLENDFHELKGEHKVLSGHHKRGDA